MQPPKLVFCPIDFSDHTPVTLEAAVLMASQFNTEICLAHVVPMLPTLPASVSWFREGEYERELHQDAERQLAEIVNQLSARGLRARYVIGTADDVGMEFVRLAAHNHTDLIVVGSHKMTGWDSVTEEVLRNARCPVLVLPAGLPSI